MEANRAKEALDYSSAYVRRFLHSPYAPQFADLFVSLIVEHFDTLDRQRVLDTLAYMDVERRREIFLRIARQSAIEGKNDLARLAADNAKQLAGTANDNEGALADLYGGMANIPTEDVADVMKRIANIPPSMLTASDRALRSAAEAMAREVLRMPEPKSSAQAEPPKDTVKVEAPRVDQASATPPAMDQQDPSAPPKVASEGPAQEEAQALDREADTQDDPEFTEFVKKGRSRLEAIDGLLDEEPNP